MKKTLGLLALTVAVSGIASADQDYLKNISYTTEIRQGWSDIDGTDSNANAIGNAGFKGNNRMRTRWRNKVEGSLALVDEGNLGLNFMVQHDNDTQRGEIQGSGKQIGDGVKTSKKEAWETNVALTKDVKLGAFDTTFALGWEHKSSRPKDNGVSGNYHTEGFSNELYFGPSTSVKLFGQDVSATLQAVYFTLNGEGDDDYAYSGNDFNGGKTEGWGINANLANSGTIAKTGFGNFTYGLELNNKFRDASKKGGREGNNSSVYLDYIASLGYKSPSFGGFYGFADLSNEWEKHTAKTGYKNNAELWLGAGYNAKVETSVGTLTINPFVKYRPWNRETAKRDDDRTTIEINEARAGLRLSLAVDR